jgi:hypothetical protein
MLVDFSKSLSYVTRCMHPLQMNVLTSIFGSYLHPRDTKMSGNKVSTKYLERRTRNSLEAITC